MFTICLGLSILATIKLPKAHVAKRLKRYIFGGCFAFTLFCVFDMLSDCIAVDADANIRAFCVTVGVACVLKYLEQCISIALKKERRRYEYR